MIKPQELRIGNWILKYGHAEQWEESDFIRSHNSIEPIPLTTEILNKSGFILMKNGNYRYVHDNHKYEIVFKPHLPAEAPSRCAIGISFDSEILDLGDGRTYDQHYEWIGISWGLKYLHSLQNIIHALTGTELNYKP